MVMEETVKKVNNNLRALHAHAVANRENPTLVSALENLVELTTLQPSKSSDDAKDEPKDTK